MYVDVVESVAAVDHVAKRKPKRGPTRSELDARRTELAGTHAVHGQPETCSAPLATD